MNERYKDYAVYLIIGLILVGFEVVIGAFFLEKFLLSNQLIILVTIFAISSATNSIVLTKLKDLNKEHESANFDDILNEISLSFTEQIVYIALTIVFSIALSVQAEPFEYFKEAILVALITVFVAAIDNLWDSTKASFILLGFDGNNRD